jgi:hypothetical protein
VPCPLSSIRRESVVKRYILDGSNLAHDGSSSTPSFRKLMDAGVSLQAVDPDAVVTICIDASLVRHLTPVEKSDYEQANRARQIAPAPAGTIGKGDAWLLEVARIARAAGEEVVLVTNDSLSNFQEENSWLFDDNQVIIGGHTIDRLGWVWVRRKPVDRRTRPTSIRRSPEEVKQIELESRTLAASVEKEQTVSNEIWSDGPEDVTGIQDDDAPADRAISAVLPKIGSIIEGKITNRKDYGVFFNGTDGMPGRIIKNNFAPEDQDKSGFQAFKLGQRVFVRVIGITDDGKLRLSLKDALAALGEDAPQVEWYGMDAEYDTHDNYVYPEGFDPETEQWQEGFGAQQQAWEDRYRRALELYERHVEWLTARQSSTV